MITEGKDMKSELWTLERVKDAITRIIPDFDTSKLKDIEFPNRPNVIPDFEDIAMKSARGAFWAPFINGFCMASEYFLYNEEHRKALGFALELIEESKSATETITMLCENLEEAVQAVKELSEELESLKGLPRGDLYPLTFSLENDD